MMYQSTTELGKYNFKFSLGRLTLALLSAFWKKLYLCGRNFFSGENIDKKKRIWEGKYQVSTGRRSVNGYERKTFFSHAICDKKFTYFGKWGGQREVRKIRELALTQTARSKE
jgi:hypothetical protein